MDNFVFDGASRVIFGKGAENGLAGEIKRFGGEKVFLHYGMGSIKKSGNSYIRSDIDDIGSNSYWYFVIGEAI